MVHTLGCSSATSALAGALVTGALSLFAPVLRLFVAVLLNSRVPLEASDLESSTIAVVRWRGGAMV
jgi:hypothetical protein